MATRRPKTSCNPCRVARIGCDAAIKKPSKCSNCVRRGKLCDTEVQAGQDANRRSRGPSICDGRLPIENATALTEIALQDFEVMTPPDSNLLSPSTSSFVVESAACRRLQASMLNTLLWDIYMTIFEMRYAIWLGDSCCPFLEMTNKPNTSIARLVLQMDGYEEANEPSSFHYRPECHGDPLGGPQRTGSTNVLIDDALRLAIYAYAVRWLPLQSAYQKSQAIEANIARKRQQDVRNHIWYRAKQGISPALTRPSYRSILALLLFTLSEMPPGDDDAGFIQLCSQAMFGHLNTLRSPIKWRVQPRISSPSTSVLPLSTNGSLLRGRRDKCSDDHQHNKDTIFWLCVVSGCTRSLVQQLPSIISPARSADHKIWQFIRQRTVIFDQSFRTLHGSQAPLPPDVAEVVLQHATACKTMYMGVINQLCDALFHHNSSSVEDAAQRVVDESRNFHNVFDHLLGMCAREYMFSSTEVQLNYVLLTTHFHLATLILADVLDAVDVVPETLKDPGLSRLHACQAVINALGTALNCDRHSSGEDTSYGSILLLDPAPELMAEVLLRTGNSVSLLYSRGEIVANSAQRMFSIINSALDVLTQVSNKASSVKSLFREVCISQNFKISDDQTRLETLKASTSDLAVLASCNVEMVRSFLQEMQIQSTLSPSHLEATVKQFEGRLIGKSRKAGAFGAGLTEETSLETFVGVF